MTSPMPGRRRPAGRYDDRSLLGARLTAVVLAALFLGLLVAIASVLYERYGTAQVRAQTIGYKVLSDQRIRIDVKVTKEPGVRAFCYVRAKGASGAEVGREAVAVDPTGTARKVVRFSHVLPTTDLAVTGEAGRCSAQPIPTASPAP